MIHAGAVAERSIRTATGQINMLYIVANTNPDIDRVACAIAYAELLNKSGQSSKAVYTGQLNDEINFVKDFLGKFSIQEKNTFDSDDQFVMVDMSFVPNPKSGVDVIKVIEVIDHREFNQIEKYINAKVDIQKVGACATSIYERFKEAKIIPSKESAVWLLSAIVSNTINLKNNVTTQRDIDAYNELLGLTDLDEKYTYKMFTAKSRIDSNNLERFYNEDFAVLEYNGKKYTIFQLEIVNLGEFVNQNYDQIIQLLQRAKKEHQIDYAGFSGIDVLNGYNIIFAIDHASANEFGRAIGTTEILKPYKTDHIIMRKEIWAKLIQ